MTEVPRPSLARAAGAILLAVVAWRGALLGVSWLGLSTSREGPALQADFRAYPAPERGARTPPNQLPWYLADAWCRWDSGWYARIAERGYYFEAKAPTRATPLAGVHVDLARRGAGVRVDRVDAGAPTTLRAGDVIRLVADRPVASPADLARAIGAFPYRAPIPVEVRRGGTSQLLTVRRTRRGPSNVAFYPAFPYLARWLGALLGVSHWTAGLIVSNLGLWLGLLAVYLIAVDLKDETIARWTVVWMLVSPGSFFLSAYLTEGLFLAASALAVLAYLRQRWWLAGLALCAATLTRPTGVALFAALALDHAWRLRKGERSWSWHALALLLGPAGLLAFMAILHHQVGDMWAFATIQAEWFGGRRWPWQTLIESARTIDYQFPRADPLGRPNAVRFVELLVAGGMVLLPVVMWRRLPPALWAFVLIAAILPLLAGRMQSSIRYAGLMFPIWLWLAELTAERPWLRAFALHVSSMLLVVFHLGYANWYWVG